MCVEHFASLEDFCSSIGVLHVVVVDVRIIFADDQSDSDLGLFCFLAFYHHLFLRLLLGCFLLSFIVCFLWALLSFLPFHLFFCLFLLFWNFLQPPFLLLACLPVLIIGNFGDTTPVSRFLFFTPFLFLSIQRVIRNFISLPPLRKSIIFLQ